MGQAGLSLAWHRAAPVMGEGADLAALLIGGLAAAEFAVLAVATLLRGQRQGTLLAAELLPIAAAAAAAAAVDLPLKP